VTLAEVTREASDPAEPVTNTPERELTGNDRSGKSGSPVADPSGRGRSSVIKIAFDTGRVTPPSQALCRLAAAVLLSALQAAGLAVGGVAAPSGGIQPR